MSFRIQSLPYESFARYFEMSAEELRRHRATMTVVDKHPGFPCRVSLEDAELGERILLVNFEHLPGDSPFRATHGIYVRESAVQKHCDVGVIPDLLRSRLLSLRSFDSAALLVEADVTPGTDLATRLEAMLSVQNVAHVDIHFAKPGCFAVRAYAA